jgi:hypothetical protein
MKIAGVIQTGSDDTWHHWTITGAHPDSTPWVLLISTEIDGRYLEIDHIYNLADEQVADVLAEWLTQSITRSGG